MFCWPLVFEDPLDQLADAAYGTDLGQGRETDARREHRALTPKPQTLTPNPTPQTPKPQTPNPKAQASEASRIPLLSRTKLVAILGVISKVILIPLTG